MRPLPLRARTFSGFSTAPPPVAIISPFSFAMPRIAWASSSLKCASPYSEKISGTLIPAASSTSESVSTDFRPVSPSSAAATVVLPQPGIPTRTIFCTSSASERKTRSISFSPISAEQKYFAPCATSIYSPPEQLIPRSSACMISSVRRGLYITSSTASHRGKLSSFTAEQPLFGYIPTGVVFIKTSQSESFSRFS